MGLRQLFSSSELSFIVLVLQIFHMLEIDIDDFGVNVLVHHGRISFHVSFLSFMTAAIVALLIWNWQLYQARCNTIVKSDEHPKKFTSRKKGKHLLRFKKRQKDESHATMKEGVCCPHNSKAAQQQDMVIPCIQFQNELMPFKHLKKLFKYAGTSCSNFWIFVVQRLHGDPDSQLCEASNSAADETVVGDADNLGTNTASMLSSSSNSSENDSSEERHSLDDPSSQSPLVNVNGDLLQQPNESGQVRSSQLPNEPGQIRSSEQSAVGDIAGPSGLHLKQEREESQSSTTQQRPDLKNCDEAQVAMSRSEHHLGSGISNISKQHDVEIPLGTGDAGVASTQLILPTVSGGRTEAPLSPSIALHFNPISDYLQATGTDAGMNESASATSGSEGFANPVEDQPHVALRVQACVEQLSLPNHSSNTSRLEQNSESSIGGALPDILTQESFDPQPPDTQGLTVSPIDGSRSASSPAASTVGETQQEDVSRIVSNQVENNESYEAASFHGSTQEHQRSQQCSCSNVVQEPLVTVSALPETTLVSTPPEALVVPAPLIALAVHMPPETNTTPPEVFAVPTQPEEALVVSSQPEEAFTVPTQPDEAYAVPTQPEEAIVVPTQPEEALAVSTQPEEALAVSTQPEEALAVPTQPEEALAVSTQPEEALAVPTQPEEALAVSTQPEEALAVSTQLEESLAVPTQPEEALVVSTQPEEAFAVSTASEEFRVACTQPEVYFPIREHEMHPIPAADFDDEEENQPVSRDLDRTFTDECLPNTCAFDQVEVDVSGGVERCVRCSCPICPRHVSQHTRCVVCATCKCRLRASPMGSTDECSRCFAHICPLCRHLPHFCPIQYCDTNRVYFQYPSGALRRCSECHHPICLSCHDCHYCLQHSRTF